MVGANPLVSHGSVLSAPRVREQLLAITERGGRVVVVDPRRTETARQFEHLPVRPDADAWLLLSMLHVDLRARGWPTASSSRAGHDGASSSRAAGRAVHARAHGRAHRRAGRARARGRACVRDRRQRGRLRAHRAPASGASARWSPSCSTRSTRSPATSTGRAERSSGDPPIPLDEIGEKAGLDTYGKIHSRFGGFPDVLGNLPATLLPREITTPGERQIRAFFVSAGNPVLSVPDGDALESALEELDLMVSIDLYVNETNRHADYVLAGDHVPRARGRPGRLHGLLLDAVHPGDRGGRAARGRGAAGVGGRRRALAAHRRRALQPACAAAARAPRHPDQPAPAGRPAAADRAARRPVRPAALAACRSRRWRASPHGIVLDDEIATGVLRAQDPPPGRARAPATTPRSPRSSRGSGR